MVREEGLERRETVGEEEPERRGAHYGVQREGLVKVLDCQMQQLWSKSSAHGQMGGGWIGCVSEAHLKSCMLCSSLVVGQMKTSGL